MLHERNVKISNQGAKNFTKCGSPEIFSSKSDSEYDSAPTSSPNTAYADKHSKTSSLSAIFVISFRFDELYTLAQTPAANDASDNEHPVLPVCPRITFKFIIQISL